MPLTKRINFLKNIVMRYTHEQLSVMSQPASDTEEEKLERARKQVVDAIQGTHIASTCDVFGKGSYYNNTNIRLNSDMDISVSYRNTFKFRLPSGDTPERHNITIVDEPYTYDKFKSDLAGLLKMKFGIENVIVKNKCIHVKENTYHSDIDVVPTWYHRTYLSTMTNTYHEGVVLWTPSHETVLNYPMQHYNNGVNKNNLTKRRYKSLVRIVKNLKCKMEEEHFYTNPQITSFLLESLVYNLPNTCFLCNLEVYDWNTIVRAFIVYVWNKTKDDSDGWKNWTEVSGLLPLMSNHKWTNEDVHEFMYKLWNFLEYK